MTPPEKLNDRQFRSLTGCSKDEFYKLLATFIITYQDMEWEAYQTNHKTRKRQPGGGRRGILDSYELRLYFILYFFKNYPTFDVLGANFDMCGTNAWENVQKLYPVLEKTLQNLNVCPARNFFDVEEFKDFMQEEEDIFIDATVRRHFRPADNEKQKEFYDGKKKAHTVKNTVISNAAKFILFLGFTVKGKIHDYALLKKEFDPSKSWFENLSVWIDLGYLGFKKDYESQEVNIPHKKPYKSKKNPNPELTPLQKKENRDISSVRVIVENAIGGFKRFRILVDTFRAKNTDLLDKSILIAASLWNFKLKFST